MCNHGKSAPDEATSWTLIRRVQEADPQAWSRFVHLYSPLIFHWCLRSGLSHSDATDLGQEVLLKVVGSIGAFKKEQPGDSLRGWLRVITQHKIIDFARKRKRQPALVRFTSAAEADIADPLDHPSELELETEQQILYRRAIDLLHRDFADVTVQAFMLSVVEGLPAAAVAETLGVSLNAVYIAKSRVLSRLRADLADS